MSTKALADFAAGIRYESLPSEVIAKAKASVRDFLGVALYVSYNTPWGQSVASFAVKQGYGASVATIIGHGKMTVPSRAALANGTFGLGFEFEDFHPWAGLHPGSFVVPAALATAEVKKASGKALISAVVAGHEVAPRVRMASNKTLEGEGIMVRGLYPQAIFGSFGAAAAAGVILSLGAEQMAIAFGLAGEQAGGTMQSHKEGAWSRRMHSGHAAERGVSAAFLAAEGFLGPKQIFDGEQNIYKALALRPHDPEKLIYAIGKHWAMMDIGYKSYSCAIGFHSAIDILLELKREIGFRAEDVEKVTVYKPGTTPIHLRTDFPTIIAAQYSAPFCIATAILQGHVRPDDFTTDALRDEQLIRFACDLVEIVPDPTMELEREEERKASPDILVLQKNPGRVILRLRDGRVFERRRDYPTGHPMQPMTDAQLLDKFMGLATTVLTHSRAEEIWQVCENLERVEDCSTLTDLLYPDTQ
jgi:2-methylcitrate dehydratase PrpD